MVFLVHGARRDLPQWGKIMCRTEETRCFDSTFCCAHELGTSTKWQCCSFATAVVTLQMPLLPFVQPAGIIPKPQWQEIRKEGEETRVEEKSQLIICKTGNFNNVEARPLPRSTSPEPWAPDKGRGTHPSQALGLSLPLPHCRLLPSWIQVHAIPEAYMGAWKWLVLTEGLPKEREKKKKNGGCFL